MICADAGSDDATAMVGERICADAGFDDVTAVVGERGSMLTLAL